MIVIPPIFGLDFTSAPSRRKPITCVQCVLQGSLLVVKDCFFFPSFADFESWLLHPGPWVAAFDFPFGLPDLLCEQLDWPTLWCDYVRHVSAIGKDQFVAAITTYMARRPAGDKLLYRLSDTLAGAISPMMLYRVPVGKMFFEGASRLLASGVSVLPCTSLSDSRVALEGYPALIARRYLGKRSYKSDDPKKQTIDQLQAREQLLAHLLSPALRVVYGFSLSVSDQLSTAIVQDPMGDCLDALLCAIQAGWSYLQPDATYGIPPGFASGGWIVDPYTLQAYLA